jgi:formate hydrogenlyase subunit 6/NADH:ubiquinone oxidoreductase subunit I
MVDWLLPIIDDKTCIACGLCAEQCPGHAVDMAPAGPVIPRPAACTYCGLCEDLCPVGAISLEYEILVPGTEDASEERTL